MRYALLLRGINVGGKNKVVMTDLGFFLDTSYCFSLRGNYMEELSFSFSSITSFLKTSLLL